MKALSTKQKHIAKQAPPANKITGADFKKLKSMKESGDHEVSMAQSSLDGIIKAAQELMMKLGSDERDIPGWIQNHITNAENYIEQAAQGFHELEGGSEEMDTSLVKIMEEIKDNSQVSSDVKSYAKSQSTSASLKNTAKRINTATELDGAFSEWIKGLGFTPKTLTISKALPIFKKALEKLNFK
jgi:hypothetical protein